MTSIRAAKNRKGEKFLREKFIEKDFKYIANEINAGPKSIKTVLKKFGSHTM